MSAKPEKNEIKGNKISQFITFHREKQGLSKTALALELGKTQPYISQIETNVRVPNLNLTREICKILKCSSSETKEATELCIQARSPEIAKRIKGYKEALAEKEAELIAIKNPEKKRLDKMLIRENRANYGKRNKSANTILLRNNDFYPFASKGQLAIISDMKKPEDGNLVIVTLKNKKKISGRYYLLNKRPLVTVLNPLEPAKPIFIDEALKILIIQDFLPI